MAQKSGCGIVRSGNRGWDFDRHAMAFKWPDFGAIPREKIFQPMAGKKNQKKSENFFFEPDENRRYQNNPLAAGIVVDTISSCSDGKKKWSGVQSQPRPVFFFFFFFPQKIFFSTDMCSILGPFQGFDNF
jgi:hypothetical protein